MQNNQHQDFTAPTAYPVFYRTYSRQYEVEGVVKRESYQQVVARTTEGLVELGKLTQDEADLVKKMQLEVKSLPSGRWMWVGGTEWVKKPEHYYGAYNCSSTTIDSWEAFMHLMNLAMQGCGTGAVLEAKHIEQLPIIQNKLNLKIVADIGTKSPKERQEETKAYLDENSLKIVVGDSRQGWVDSYYFMLVFAGASGLFKDSNHEVTVMVDLSNVRPAGEKLKGFGGVANPASLPQLYIRVADILNVVQAEGRKLTSVECSLLIDEAALVIVAGNIRRCLPENALVHTCTGLVPIKDVQVGDLVETPIGFRRVVNKFYQGVQEVYNILTNHTTPRATLNHQYAIFVDDGDDITRVVWKRVKDLKEGDIFIHTDTHVTVKQIVPSSNEKTYDIEVDEAHCFYCEGYLTHNSAGMRQGSSDDALFAVAKDNLWQQDEGGNWRIDPKRDALRMANHTRVFHHKPTLEECIASVGKQYFSGEGAIQWAGEAIARANCDVLDDVSGHKQFEYSTRKQFLYLYNLSSDPGKIQAEHFLRECYKNKYDAEISPEELDDRMQRYGLNPCFRGDMKLLTVSGYKTFEELEGTELFIINASGMVSKSKVWCSGHRETIELLLASGDSIFCTPDHVLLTNKGDLQAKNTLGSELHVYLGFDFEEISESLLNNSLVKEIRPTGVTKVYDFTEPKTNWGVVNGVVAHNCGEILLNNNLCNLSEVHLNNLGRVTDWFTQEKAFKAASLSAASLLHHRFVDERYQKSHELDPIVGVSITGLFDFFVKMFGREWLEWWQAGRPDTQTGKAFKNREKIYLTFWKEIVHETVWEYCDRHGLKRPNRCTTVQPSGSKSLLTNASPGWHPPKATRYIRRITFRKNDPVALACKDYGYSLIPSQSDKDESGLLLDDPFDPRCTEWLVEIPVEVSWADLAEGIDVSKFSALAQFDFMMQVQKYYVTHNCSATLELTESEIEPLGTRIYEAIQNDKGYISSALLARFEDLQTYPRLPFEPISKERYQELVKEVEQRRVSDNFHSLVAKYDLVSDVASGTSEGVTGCDSDKCLFPEIKPV